MVLMVEFRMAPPTSESMYPPVALATAAAPENVSQNLITVEEDLRRMKTHTRLEPQGLTDHILQDHLPRDDEPDEFSHCYLLEEEGRTY